MDCVGTWRLVCEQEGGVIFRNESEPNVGGKTYAMSPAPNIVVRGRFLMSGNGWGDSNLLRTLIDRDLCILE